MVEEPRGRQPPDDRRRHVRVRRDEGREGRRKLRGRDEDRRVDGREVPLRGDGDEPKGRQRDRGEDDQRVQPVPRGGDGVQREGTGEEGTAEREGGEGDRIARAGGGGALAPARSSEGMAVAPGLHAEERTEAGRGLLLADLLLFLLLFLLLVFLLLARRGRGSGGAGRHDRGRRDRLVDVHALEGGGQRLHAGLVDLHAGGGEDLLQVLLVHRLPGRVQDKRAIDVLHVSFTSCVGSSSFIRRASRGRRRPPPRSISPLSSPPSRVPPSRALQRTRRRASCGSHRPRPPGPGTRGRGPGPAPSRGGTSRFPSSGIPTQSRGRALGGTQWTGGAGSSACSGTRRRPRGSGHSAPPRTGPPGPSRRPRRARPGGTRSPPRTRPGGPSRRSVDRSRGGWGRSRRSPGNPRPPSPGACSSLCPPSPALSP